MHVLIYIVYIYYLCIYIYIYYIHYIYIYIYTIFTGKSAYAQKSTSLELEAPFWHEAFNECLPRMSVPLFSQNGHLFEK